MNYEKITKTQARKMHTEGGKVFCLPKNTCTNSMWMSPAEIPTERNFESFCNEYQWYNCNAELGRTLAFYKEVM